MPENKLSDYLWEECLQHLDLGENGPYDSIDEMENDLCNAVKKWLANNPKLPELKAQSDKARKSLSEFYTQLPTIKDSGVVIAELQTHIGELIDHIIDTHNFFDSLLDLSVQKDGDKQ